MPTHPKPAPRPRAIPARPPSPAGFAYLGGFSDAQLDAHINLLESWLDFQTEEMDAAITERERRGGASYVLTPVAEAWLAANAQRLEALL